MRSPLCEKKMDAMSFKCLALELIDLTASAGGDASSSNAPKSKLHACILQNVVPTANFVPLALKAPQIT